MAHLATRLAQLLRARSTVLPARTLQVPIPTKLTAPGPILPALQSAARSARQTAKAEAHSEAQFAEWAVCMIRAASGRSTQLNNSDTLLQTTLPIMLETRATKPSSPCEQRVAFHHRQVGYHQAAVVDHARRGELNAEWRHQVAAHAHETLMDGRDDTQAESAALRLSGIAEQASYQAKKNRSRM